jgi:shikimate kinase
VTDVVLIGLMGSGKSSVARAVVKQTGWSMVDVDVAIEQRTGKNVRQLWEAGGEDAYRELESQVVVEALLGDEIAVVAAPGGSVLDPKVQESLADAYVIWLRATPASLAARVRVGDHRPLLGDDPYGALARMARDRAEIYAELADEIVDTDELSASGVAKRVLELIVGHGTNG